MVFRLLVIDPQCDFCDGPCNGALPIPGADADMRRLAAFVDRFGPRLDHIQVTLDSHHLFHIANPLWWRNAEGLPPPPFTVISVADVESGHWRPRRAADADYALFYVRELAHQGRYALTIWPPHCLVGTPGHAVHPTLMAALMRWTEATLRPLSFVTKGENSLTEHYSAYRAEVSDHNDPATGPNAGMRRFIEEACVVAIAGEAKSHCVRATVTDLAHALGPDQVRKFVFLDDCSSPVPAIPGGPDFPAMAQSFITDVMAQGMRLTTSTAFALDEH